MLKLLVPRFRSDLSFRLRYAAEKQVPAKLKPIVDTKPSAYAVKMNKMDTHPDKHTCYIVMEYFSQ